MALIELFCRPNLLVQKRKRRAGARIYWLALRASMIRRRFARDRAIGITIPRQQRLFHADPHRRPHSILFPAGDVLLPAVFGLEYSSSGIAVQPLPRRRVVAEVGIPERGRQRQNGAMVIWVAL